MAGLLRHIGDRARHGDQRRRLPPDRRPGAGKPSTLRGRLRPRQRPHGILLRPLTALAPKGTILI